MTLTVTAITLLMRLDHDLQCLEGIRLAMLALEDFPEARAVRHLLEDHQDKLVKHRADLARLHGIDEHLDLADADGPPAKARADDQAQPAETSIAGGVK